MVLRVACKVQNVDVLTIRKSSFRRIKQTVIMCDEVWWIICGLSFQKSPFIVLSAMGKTTNNLIAAGEKAASCVSVVSEIDELAFLKELHNRTVEELGLEKTLIADHLEKLGATSEWDCCTEK